MDGGLGDAIGQRKEWRSRVWFRVFKLELTLSVCRGLASREGVCGGRPCGSAVFPVLWAPVVLGFSLPFVWPCRFLVGAMGCQRSQLL